MSYSEETMNRISQALAGGALASTGADRGADTSGESEGVRERFLHWCTEDDGHGKFCKACGEILGSEFSCL